MSRSRILPVASLSSGATRSQRHAEEDPTTRTGTVHCSCGLRRPPERDRATKRAGPPTGSQASDHTGTSADPVASSARRALGPFAAEPPPHAVNRLQDRRAETGRRRLTHRRLSGRLLSRESARPVSAVPGTLVAEVVTSADLCKSRWDIARSNSAQASGRYGSRRRAREDPEMRLIGCGVRLLRAAPSTG